MSISTNDAEVQALVETEDVLFRTKLLWAEMHGAGAFDKGRNFLLSAEAEARQLDGILGTDSKGGYDSIMVNESPLLGLTNMRAAIQAEQLKQALPLAGTVLYWLASDWNLSDALTKKKDDCRESMKFFLKTCQWMLKFDPNFVVSAKKLRAVSGSPAVQMARLSRS